jgi:hypothetical protein
MIKSNNLIARAVTSGPMHHFFGYFGIQPWDAAGRYLVCLEVPFHHRVPRAEDKATVGVVELSSKKFIPLAETSAWNFQQASMMHWLPTAPDSEIIFNDREVTRFVSVIINVHTGERRTLPRPVGAMSHNGKTALSYNFGRLQWTRRDYGYAGLDDPYAGKHDPLEDGIYSVDLESDEYWRVVSLADVFAALGGKPDEMKDHPVFFNHAAYNTDDSRFAFLIQWTSHLLPKWARMWRLKKLEKLGSIMFTAKTDGSELRCVSNFENVSHYDWRNAREILMWANLRGHQNFYLVADGEDKFRAIGEKVLTEDGHCSFSPNRRWILTDTYRDPRRTQYSTLKMFAWEQGPEFILGRYYSPPAFVKEIRCDLHPRWNRTGTHICFDSIHEGTRQLYVMDVSSLTGEL